MKNNKSQKNTPSLGGLFFKSNRDLIKFIKPTWYGDLKRIGPTGGPKLSDFEDSSKRIRGESEYYKNKIDNSKLSPDEKQATKDEVEANRERLSNRVQDLSARAMQGIYAPGFYTSNDTPPEGRSFGNSTATSGISNNITRMSGNYAPRRDGPREDYDPSSSRSGTDSKGDPLAPEPATPSPTTRDKKDQQAEDALWSRMHIEGMDYEPRGPKEKAANKRITDRLRVAQAASAADDADRDARDPEANKRMAAAMAPRTGNRGMYTRNRDDSGGTKIIQDAPLRRLRGGIAVVLPSGETLYEGKGKVSPKLTPNKKRPAQTGPAVRPVVQPTAQTGPVVQPTQGPVVQPTAQTGPVVQPTAQTGPVVQPTQTVQEALDQTPRPPVKRRSIMDTILNRPSRTMQELRRLRQQKLDEREVSALQQAGTLGNLRTVGDAENSRFAPSTATPRREANLGFGRMGLERINNPNKPSVWDAGKTGVERLRNMGKTGVEKLRNMGKINLGRLDSDTSSSINRSMLHVDRDTMRLNKAVNNAFRKSKKKKLTKAEWQDNLKTQNHHEVLGVKPGASPEEINLAFRKLSKEYNPHLPGGSRAKIESLIAARDALKGNVTPNSTPHMSVTAADQRVINNIGSSKASKPSANNPATSATGPLHAAGPVSAPTPVGATVSPGLKPGANTAKQTVAKLEPSPEIKPPTDSISIPDFQPVTQNRPASAGSQIFQGLNTFNAIMDNHRANIRLGPGASQERKYDRTARHLADSSLLRAFQRSLSKARRDYNELVTNNVVPQEVEGTAKEDTGYKQFTGRTLTSAGRHHARYVAPYEGLGVKRETHAMDQGSITDSQPLTAKIVLRSAKTRHKNNQLPVQRVYTGRPKDITFSGKPGDDT